VCGLECALTSPHTTRGIGADIIIVDETAFVPPEFLVKVVLPIAGNTLGACVVFISTRNRPLDAFDLLISRTDASGQPILDVHFFREEVCPMCEQRLGLKTCEHADATRPAWVSSEKQDRFKALTDGAANEMAGGLNEGLPPAFNPESVGPLLRGAPVPTAAASAYYIGIDPNQGGTKSRAAIIAAQIVDGAAPSIIVRPCSRGSRRGCGGARGRRARCCRRHSAGRVHRR
jgi:hypothetical protein